MERTDATTQEQVYHPRNPRASPLYRCVCEHADELREAGHIHRRVEDQTLDRLLDCDDLHKGFARVHCNQCGREYLLPFSCKTRCFCPSCHHNFAWSEIGRRQAQAVCAPRMVRIEKRMLIYGEWVEEEVLVSVPHRRYVLTVPKVLRGVFHQRHRLILLEP